MLVECEATRYLKQSIFVMLTLRLDAMMPCNPVAAENVVDSEPKTAGSGALLKTTY